MKNFNHTHQTSGGVISGIDTDTITVGQLRDAIAEFPDDAEVYFGGTEEAGHLAFYRFKTRSPKLLHMEFRIDLHED